MNQIIIENRHKIDTACQLCFYTLDKYNKAVEAFHEEKRKITATPYIQQEQERLVNRAAETLRNTALAHYEEIKHSLGDIRTAAVEMENLLDVGEDLQNALSVIKALGKSLPSETRVGLVNQFKGQRQALTILKTAYESADISAEPYFEGMIFSSSAALDQLDDMAYRIVMQPGTDLMVVVSFGTELEKFALSLGVELTKHFRDIVDTTAATNQQLRAAAGLGASD